VGGCTETPCLANASGRAARLFSICDDPVLAVPSGYNWRHGAAGFRHAPGDTNVTRLLRQPSFGRRDA
jgi:hypothetical protein